MPEKPTHSIFTLAGAVVTPAALLYVGLPTSELSEPVRAVLMVTGFLVSLEVNPDLDLNSRFPKKNPAKWPWWCLWYPYSRLIGHRSPWSHFPLIGTALRVLYILVPLLLAARLLEVRLDIFTEGMAYMLAGLATSDMVHAGLDAIDALIIKIRRLT